MLLRACCQLKNVLQRYISHCFVTPGCVLFALCSGVLRHVMAILQVLPACFLGVLCQIAAVLQEQGGGSHGARGSVLPSSCSHCAALCRVMLQFVMPISQVLPACSWVCCVR